MSPTTTPPRRDEIAIPAATVRPGDVVLGLGPVSGVTTGGKTATLHGEFSLWRATVDAHHRVVVLRVLA